MEAISTKMETKAKLLDMKASIGALIDESIEVKKSLHSISEDITKLSLLCINAIRNGNKILICGNGGSAADAQHFATELVVKYKHDRKSIPCIALTTDSSVLTAIINDYSGEEVYAKQVEGLGTSGDILIGISTSGKALNVRKAFEEAKELGIKTVALTGAGSKGQDFAALADLALIVPSSVTSRIQECHITILHILAELIDRELFLA